MQVSIAFDPLDLQDVQRVRDFIDALSKPTAKEKAGKKTKAEVIDQNSIDPKPVDIHVDTPKEAKEVVKLDKELLLANTQVKLQEGKREQVKALLNELGSQNVSGLKEDKYEEYNRRLAAL